MCQLCDWLTFFFEKCGWKKTKRGRSLKAWDRFTHFPLSIWIVWPFPLVIIYFSLMFSLRQCLLCRIVLYLMPRVWHLAQWWILEHDMYPAKGGTVNPALNLIGSTKLQVTQPVAPKEASLLLMQNLATGCYFSFNHLIAALIFSSFNRLSKLSLSLIVSSGFTVVL